MKNNCKVLLFLFPYEMDQRKQTEGSLHELRNCYMYYYSVDRKTSEWYVCEAYDAAVQLN